MRQAGVLAAAGLVALDTMVDRLADDHQETRARWPRAWPGCPGIDCDLSRVQTNIVYFRLKNMDAASFLAACSSQGLRGGGRGDQVRFVTHHGIGPADIQRALLICREALRGDRRPLAPA